MRGCGRRQSGVVAEVRLVVQQQIEIDRPRPPSLRASPAQFAFDLLQAAEQFLRRSEVSSFTAPLRKSACPGGPPTGAVSRHELRATSVICGCAANRAAAASSFACRSPSLEPRLIRQMGMAMDRQLHESLGGAVQAATNCRQCCSLRLRSPKPSLAAILRQSKKLSSRAATIRKIPAEFSVRERSQVACARLHAANCNFAQENLARRLRQHKSCSRCW